MRTLNNLSLGEEGTVKKVGSSGSLRRRMIDMGLTTGAKIKLLKRAPGGDPIEVQIYNYKLSIRQSEAREIEIFEKDEEEEFKKSFENKLYSSKSHVYNVSDSLSTPICGGKRQYKAALVGNPNCGKTTLFNKLTGSYQYVGNWPGVTVERKEGRIKNLTDSINLVDLPGVYSLSPYSPEEVVTRTYITQEMPDIIINILDATNLERNLYLTTQLLELDCKIILVLNMTDLLKNKEIDYKELEKKFGVPIVLISAGKNKGINKLLETLSMYIKKTNYTRNNGSIYSEPVEEALQRVDKIINKNNVYVTNNRFKSIKVFENDPLILKEYNLSQEQSKEIEVIRKNVGKYVDKEEDTIIPEERYRYIYEICGETIRDFSIKEDISFSEKIDRIVTGKYTALPFFIAVVFLIFYTTFGPLGIMLRDLCETFINTKMYSTLESILNYARVSDWIKSLMLDAVVKGVGAVISFLPQIILLFTLLSILEDCGYMSRAAFIMDKPMRKIGLSGKACVPLIMGFGCTVPAVLGTKILESKKDKNLVIFLIPFISCSAKMPFYLLMASTFFPNFQMAVIFGLYGFGILCACFTAWLFKDFFNKTGEDSPFIMEMPDYKWPSLRNIRLNVWDKTRDFIERAGTIILVATIIVWCLQYIGLDLKPVTDSSSSILGKMGECIAPIFKLCGFGDWKISVSLITGLMAKESIVSTLSVLYAGGSSLSEALSRDFSWVSGLSLLIFSLLYTPCVAAVSTIYKEYEEKKLAIFSVIYQMLIAYFMSAITYQTITLFIKIFS